MKTRGLTYVQEERLLHAWHTQPSNMAGAPRLRQHDNLQKQISAFEKLVQHAISKFSNDKCYQMVKLLYTSFAGDLPPAPGGSTHEHGRLVSLSQVRELLTRVRKGYRKSSNSGKIDDGYIIKYFENFFDDIKYLEELKRNFDSKIYMCLYEYYYDPSDVITEADLRSTNSGKLDAEDDEEGGVVVASLDPKQKLSYSVKQMFRVNSKWEKLYTDYALDTRWFDPDSFQELINYDNFYQFEPVFRLVPDIFTKAFKSIELAKLWWTHFNKVYPDAPLVKRTKYDFDIKVQKLETDISRYVIHIMREDDNVEKWKRELRVLKARDTRFHQMSKDCEYLESRKNQLDHHYSTVLAERENLKQDLSRLRQGTKDYVDKELQIVAKWKACVRAKHELGVATYKFGLTQADFNVELLVRPDIILFIADLEEKIAAAEKDNEHTKMMRRIAEKKLALIRTNTENMKRIMEKIIASEKRPESSKKVKIPERSRTKKDTDDDRWEDRNDE